MKKLLLIVLLLSLGFSQKLTEVDRGYYENGQKSYEGTIKDGKPDGLFTSWYENGQKNEEATYKDGEMISEECWDEDGNEKDCN